jgi:hypothetical protein
MNDVEACNESPAQFGDARVPRSGDSVPRAVGVSPAVAWASCPRVAKSPAKAMLLITTPRLWLFQM